MEPPTTGGGSSAAGSPSSLSQASVARAGGGEFCPQAVQELRESKQELIIKVQGLKKELADWRGRMGQQVEAYRGELTALQSTLVAEMGGVRGELAEVKARIRAQLEANDGALGALRAAGAGDPPTVAALALGAPASSSGSGAS